MTVDAAPHARLAYAGLQLAAPPGQDGPIVFVASSRRVNRYGFTLRTEGWRLDNFEKNPALMWNHDMSRPPIGRARVELDTWRGELRAGLTFDRRDAFAADIERRVREGWLSAISVGWDFVNEDGSPIANWWSLKPEQ